MSVIFKLIALALIAAGIAVTLYLAGSSSKVVICGPFLFFGGATWIGRRSFSGVCTAVGLGIAVAIGASSYYQAFRVHQHGEVDALAVIFVPIIQSAIGLLVLLVAVGDWLHFRFKRHGGSRI